MYLCLQFDLSVALKFVSTVLSNRTLINPVFLLQKKVVVAISFEHFTSSSTTIFFNMKILKFHDLFKLKLLSFVFDCDSKTSPSCFHSFFPLA